MAADSYRYVPIRTNIATIELMTPEQRSAVSRLAQKEVSEIILRPDTLYNGAVLFNLIGLRGPNDHFLHGLIEPDGSVNT